MVGTHYILRPVLVYLAGVVTGPVIRPVARGAVKGTVKAGLGLKRITREAASEVKGIAAEAEAESKTTQTTATVTPPVVVTAKT